MEYITENNKQYFPINDLIFPQKTINDYLSEYYRKETNEIEPEKEKKKESFYSKINTIKENFEDKINTMTINCDLKVIIIIVLVLILIFALIKIFSLSKKINYYNSLLVKHNYILI